jgi:hypothetical protein
MGNVLKPSVTGIDIPIQKYQTFLYNGLRAKWNIETMFNMYGRAYRNQTQDGYTPEIYKGNDEYSDSYFDDTLHGSAFWGVGEQTKVSLEGDITAQVFVIFMVNLNFIKPSFSGQRNDEEVRVDVATLAVERFSGFFLTGIITGIDQVFKEYSGYKAVKGIKFRDMQPWHCFRLNFQVNYNIYDCN